MTITENDGLTPRQRAEPITGVLIRFHYLRDCRVLTMCP